MVLYLNWRLALVVILIIPLTYISAQFILKKSQPYFKKQADALGDMNGFVQENLTGFNVIKLFVVKKFQVKNFVKSLKICKKLVSRQALFQEL